MVMIENKNDKIIAETTEKLRSLNLFSDDSTVREVAISLLPKNAQEQTRKFLTRSVYANKLKEILMADLYRSGQELRKNRDDQFWLRTTVRTLAATIDGIVFILKEMAHSSAEFNGLRLSDDEKFLLERRARLQKGEKAKFKNFNENFKETFKIYARLAGFPCPTDFNHDGFAALCEIYELRHHITHPKSFMKFCVSPEETQKMMKAATWLDVEISRLIDGHNQKLISNIEIASAANSFIPKIA
jgi:hypothetical protein